MTMTTFNLKNQSRKHLYLRFVISALLIVVVITGIFLIIEPQFLDILRVNHSKTLSQVNANNLKQQINNEVKQTSETDFVKLDNESKDSANDNSIVVNTKSGKIRGTKSVQIGVEVNTFLGIPYGSAPSGKLRFRRTVAVKPWRNILNATKIPPACIQSKYTQRLFPVKILNCELSEDCLYLNIWSPNISADNSPLPVLIWIHGGMFTIGSVGVDEYDGSVLAVYGNVVVVSIQYRLGLFGFLDLETEEIPGNMGLWDQAMAIKWVHENIDNFGGDPNLITLVGESAGGISIGLHMLSPITKNLFKRVIIQSGSPMLLNQIYSRGPAVAENFAKKIGCLSEGTDIYEAAELIVKCIDNTPLNKISDAQQEMVKNNPVPFLPTIPSEYAEYFPNEDNSNITYEQKDVLIGFNRDEGNLILHLSYPENYTRNTVPVMKTLEEAKNAITLMAIDGGFPETQAKSMASVLLKGNETDSPENWARKIGSVFGDIMFVCPTVRFADKFSNLNKTVYMYVFTQRPHNSVWGKWMGVTHHDELNFVFGVPLRYPNLFDGNDINLSKRIIKTWAHFARTGFV